MSSSLWWLTNNAMVEALPGPPGAAHPGALRATWSATRRRRWPRRSPTLGLSVQPALVQPEPGTVHLGGSHSVAGNPMRFTTGDIPLHVDEAWRTAMRPRDRRTVGALTFPLRAWYSRSEERRVSSPAVSVVIPTREPARAMRDAVRAALTQEYDGPDRGRASCFDQSPADEGLTAELADVVTRPRSVRIEQNARPAGLAGARNHGIAAAGGELVAFCDDDDYWLPGKLAPRLAVFESPPGHEHRLHRHQRDVRRRDVRPAGPGGPGHLHRPAARPDDRAAPLDLPDAPGRPLERRLRRGRRAGAGLATARTTSSCCGPAVRRRCGRSCAPLAVVRWHQNSFFRRWDTIAEGLTWLLERYPEFESVPKGSARVRGQIAFAHAALGAAPGGVLLGAGHHPPQPVRAAMGAGDSCGAAAVNGRQGHGTELHRTGQGDLTQQAPLADRTGSPIANRSAKLRRRMWRAGRKASRFLHANP